MIPKQHVPDLIRDGYRFSEKIMLITRFVRRGLARYTLATGEP